MKHTRTALIIILSVVLLVALTLTLCGCEESRIFNDSVEIKEGDYEGKTFPFIHIEVSDEITKEEYAECNISLDNTEEEYVLSEVTAKIKGRGNSTWGMPKKPYKIKFSDKVDLLGNGAAKSWVLLANYCDKSLSRGFMASEVGRAIGLTETTTTQPVNVMLNGVYQGVYLLCEQVEIGKTRLNIKSDLEEVDTGYLVELDARAPEEGEEGVDYFYVAGIPYGLKDPDRGESDFTQEHFDHIKNCVTAGYEAITGDDYEQVLSLIDVESFAKCYLVHELFGCVDVGFSSFYIYKKGGGKLYAGPLWDFDISSGNCDYVETCNRTDYLYAKESNPWYRNLLRFEQFRALVAEELAASKETIEATIQKVYDYQLTYKENNETNFAAWEILDKYVWPNPPELVEIETFEGQLDYLKDWVSAKLLYMTEAYALPD